MRIRKPLFLNNDEHEQVTLAGAFALEDFMFNRENLVVKGAFLKKKLC